MIPKTKVPPPRPLPLAKHPNEHWTPCDFPQINPRGLEELNLWKKGAGDHFARRGNKSLPPQEVKKNSVGKNFHNLEIFVPPPAPLRPHLRCRKTPGNEQLSRSSPRGRFLAEVRRGRAMVGGGRPGRRLPQSRTRIRRIRSGPETTPKGSRG